MKEKIPFYNEKEFHDMVKKTKRVLFQVDILSTKTTTVWNSLAISTDNLNLTNRYGLMKEKIPFYNEKEFHDMVKKTKKGTFSGWYIINPENKSVEFSGNFNRQFKLNKPVIPVNTEYVTRKEFNEYKDSNDQRLTKIETELKSQGQRIQVVEDKVDRLTEVVMKKSTNLKLKWTN